MSDFIIRKATSSDLDAIKSLTDAHKNELGFVLRPALVKSIERGEILVSENSRGVIGFVEYHHRQDEQTTLYHIVVQPEHRQLDIGRKLVEALLKEAGEHNKSFIQLKCPIDLEANKFYEQLGFLQVDTQPGKKRDLVIWKLPVGSATLYARDHITR